jgi:hypothetical protein
MFRKPWTAAVLAASMAIGITAAARAEPRVTADPGLAASDTALLKDEDKAKAELERRLRSQATYRDGVLVLIDRSGAGGVTVMPATVMWSVECSDGGLAVTFGSGSGDTDNGIVLQLTAAAIGDDKCSRLAPAIGLAVLALTKGN